MVRASMLKWSEIWSQVCPIRRRFFFFRVVFRAVRCAPSCAGPAPNNPRMSVRFGFQQKERERKERQRSERKAREREETERYEMEKSVRQRVESGDLKDTVASRVRQMLETTKVEERIQQRTNELIVAKREEELRAIEKARTECIAAARRKEEERLSEAQRLKDILEENKRKVDDEARRRAEGETRAMLERQAELRERDAAARIEAERRLRV